MSLSQHVTLVASVVMLTLGCGPTRTVPIATVQQAVDLDRLWRFPDDLTTRDLLSGPGGAELRPDSASNFQFVAKKTSGTNPGYDVRDGSGRLWSVKLGKEAQPEVVTSRILWSIGFHQPAIYYLEEWHMTGQQSSVQPEGRFRFEPEDHQIIGEWSWYENPFTNTQPLKGLLVAQLIVNNWDWKTSNNKIYQLRDGSGIRQVYVVRDLGAALGAAMQAPLFKWFNIRHLQGTKNDLAGFERQPFIEGIADERIKFAYSGLDRALVRTLRSQDVRWTCALLAQLTDRQWEDAFRAGGYPQEQRRRYIAKIKEKIAQGLNLAGAGT
jgi:hypothetical protein